MGYVILVCSNNSLADLISLNLRVFLGMQVIIRNDAKGAIDILKILPEFRIIMCQAGPNEGDDSAKYLNEYLEAHLPDSFFVTLGGGDRKYSMANECVPELYGWRDGLRSIIKHIGLSGIKFDDSIIPDYLPMNTHMLKYGDVNLADFFVKIERKDDRPKYVMRLKKGEQTDPNELEEIHSKGIKDLYFVKSERFNVCKEMVQILSKRLESEDLSTDERIEITSALQMNLKEVISNIGFSNSTIKACDRAVKSMEKLTNVDHTLVEYYEKIKNNPNYQLTYGISQLTAYFATSIVQHLGWTSKDVQISKLVTASFFNDMTIENERLCLIRDIKNPQYMQLTADERNHVREHAFRSSMMIEQNPKILSGVSDIILEHHGVKSGKGFSDTIEPNISPLSIIFIISEAIAVGMVGSDENMQETFELEEIYFTVKAMYLRNHTKQYLKAFEECFGIG